MIIYNILIGLLIILLIYAVVLIIQNYNSKPVRPIGPPLNPQPIHPVNPINPINPPTPPVIPNNPVSPSPTSTWSQDNIIELDSYLRNFFSALFQNKRELIKDDTYKYVEQTIMDKYSYADYKNLFIDFSKTEYLYNGNDTLYYWKNKIFKPVAFPSDDNINLAVFILENLDKYQPLTKLSFENMYNYYGGEDWGDNIQQAEDCIYVNYIFRWTILLYSLHK